MEYLVGETESVLNTQQSYRDAVRLLVVFAATKAHKRVDDAPSPVTKLGYWDRTLLLFLYNSGARAEEAAKLRIEDLSLHSGADGALSSVCFHGKGGKVRICPLWPPQPQS